MEDLENEMTYDPEPEPQMLEDDGLMSQPEEKKPGKKNKKKKFKKGKKTLLIKVRKKKDHDKDGVLKLRAVKNFMLWDKTMVRAIINSLSGK
jgi:hypothetical protein